MLSATEITALKLGAGVVSGVFALVAAYISFREAFRSEEQRQADGRYVRVWQSISSSTWLSLPELIIHDILIGANLISSKVRRYIWTESRVERWLLTAFGVLVPALFAFSQWGIQAAANTELAALVLIGTMLIPRPSRGFAGIIVRVVVNLTMLGIVGTLYFWIPLWVVVHLPPPFSAVAMLSLAFLGWRSVLMFRFVNVSDRRGRDREAALQSDGELTLAIISIPVSLGFTLAAISLGSLLRPELPVPDSLQLLLANLLFDVLTVLVTLWLLKWSVSASSLARVPVAVFLDLLASAVFACASVYLGLLGTTYSIEIGEAIRILAGRAPSGPGAELGPLFWAMHTTFLPTFGYLFWVFAAWLAKSILVAVGLFLKRSLANRNLPLLTAALLTLLAAIFGLIATGLGIAEGRAQERRSRLLLSTLDDRSQEAENLAFRTSQDVDLRERG